MATLTSNLRILVTPCCTIARRLLRTSRCLGPERARQNPFIIVATCMNENRGLSPISGLQLPAAPQQSVAERAQPGVDREQQQRAQRDRRIRLAEEAEAEARNDVEEGVGVADRSEQRRQRIDRVEGARQQGQGRDDEIADRGGTGEPLPPD